MKILLINHYAGGPRWGMEYRPYYLAREWVRTGHQVTIAAATYSHVRATQPEASQASGVVEETLDGIRYRWYPTPAYRGNGFGRLANVRAFLKAVAADKQHLAERFAPDVVIASSTYPLDVKVAGRIARACGALLVYEVHDLWPLSLIELSGLSRLHPFVWWCGAAERAAYRNADLVVSMLPKVHDHMRARGLNLGKLAIVPNGIAPEEWLDDAASWPDAHARHDDAHARHDEAQARHDEAHARHDEARALRDDVQSVINLARRQGRTVVGYAGSMGKPNALDVLLAAAATLQDERFAFVLVGDGHEREALQRSAREGGLASVTFLPPVPKAQVPSLLRAFDIAYIGWRRSPLYRFGIAPNKLMDYMMAGCTVLHSVHAGNDPVRDADCGLSVEPEDPKAVARALRQLALLPPRDRVLMGRRGRDYVLGHHAYPVLAERFLDAVRQRARSRRATS